MICLYRETHPSTFAMILYTCVCLPFLQIYEALFTLCKFLLDPHHQDESNEDSNWELDVPVSRFQELQTVDQETCSICLEEFEGEDSVNKLPKCGHLFHAECMVKWLDRCQFSCPLCRSSVLQARSSPCKSTAPPFCIVLSNDHDS